MTEGDGRLGAFMEAHVGHLLRRAYARAKANTADALAALGEVSPVQAAALAALMDGPLTQAELGRRIDMEPANTHSLAARMRVLGLVTPGRPLALTGEGEALAGRLEPAIKMSGRRTMAALDEEERIALLRLLERIVSPPPHGEGHQP